MTGRDHTTAAQDRTGDAVYIQPAEDRHAINQFIRLPWSIYAGDKAWIPPLIIERRQHLSPRNPYFAHAKCRTWIAWRAARPVGRISAQIDQLHLERYQDDTGFFGMLEAENDPEAFALLLRTAEGWLHRQGMRRVLGPFNLSINQECGLLVEGFDAPPSIMMGHARPYYAARVEEDGYIKAKDLLAYRIAAEFKSSKAMQTIMKRTSARIRLRALRRSRFDDELAILQDIFNDAWSGNWNFVPFTDAEFHDLGKHLKLLVAEGLVQIAEVDGIPAAMMVVLPNLNEVIQDLNGRLLPWGWLKILWRMKVSHPKTARIALMGVRRRFQGSLLGAALAFMVIEAARRPALRRGIREVEMSWILEDNLVMRNIIESLGGVLYKRYRIYQKPLS